MLTNNQITMVIVFRTPTKTKSNSSDKLAAFIATLNPRNNIVKKPAYEVVEVSYHQETFEFYLQFF